MSELREHHGVSYSIPSNDDGVWRYKIHPGRIRARSPRPVSAVSDGYETHAEAITAAELAIDGWLEKQ